MIVPTHLVSAARTLEQILAEVHPEYRWVVTVRQDELFDRPRDTTTSGRLDESGAVRDDAHPVRDRNDAATTAGALDEHGLDQAA